MIPFSLNENWNLITRTIVPLIWQPEFAPSQGTTFGLGDIQLSTFVSPSNPSPSGLIWGAGAIVQMPTDSNGLGNKNWGLGPTAVALHLQKGDPWVFGALANNVWSLSSDGRGGAYNNFLLQPFVNYNFPEGFYLTSAPIVTANWEVDNEDRWTVPLGGGVGKIFHLGRLPREHPALRVLQRRRTGRRRGLVDAVPGAVHVPEVSGQEHCQFGRNNGIKPLIRPAKCYQRHTGEGRYPVARIARPFDWIPGQARNDEVHAISWPHR